VVVHCRRVRSAVEKLLFLLDADVVPVDADLARRAVGTGAVSVCLRRLRLPRRRILKSFFVKTCSRQYCLWPERTCH
jgi:hypothetical protein